MEFAKIYQNKSNGQKSISLPKSADIKPGFTAFISSAGNAYEEIPPEMQAQVLLRIAVEVVEEAEAKLNEHMETFNSSERLCERSTVRGVREILSAVEDDIRRKYVPDDSNADPSPEEIEAMEAKLARKYTVEG